METDPKWKEVTLRVQLPSHKDRCKQLRVSWAETAGLEEREEGDYDKFRVQGGQW